MHISADDVSSIVSEVWTSMLGTEAAPTDEELNFNGNLLAASVGVTGSADCLIAMEMDVDGATKYAALMFGLDESEVSDAEVTDAAGELTNMVGGNIKNLLPEPSQLSLPIVAKGSNPPTLRVVGGSVLLKGSYLCEGHPIVITVWARPGS